MFEPLAVYHQLFDQFGPQDWWPRHKEKAREGFDPAFEIMVGAILTQNTAWKNVEKAIEALYEKQALTASAILRLNANTLKALIRPAGYFNQKAKKLKIFSQFILANTKPTRTALLSQWGIGPETADSILLYAFHQPIFVVDAYTRRLLRAHGENELATADYDRVRAVFESLLPIDSQLFNEYHALIVAWGKYESFSSRKSQS